MNLRPSSSKFWFNCPGQPALVAKQPPRETGDPALEGTCAAWVAEMVMAGKYATPRDMIGLAHPENGWVVDADMAVHLTRYVELLRREANGGQMRAEQFVQLNALIGGTTDAWGIVGAGHVKAIDLKYGFGVVDPVFNTQVSIYLGALVKQLPPHSVHTVTVAIYQPRATHPMGHYRQWTIDARSFMQWVATIEAAGDLCQSPDAPVKAGPWCVDCDAAGVCSALGDSLYRMYSVAQMSEQRQLRGEELTSELQFLRDAGKMIETRTKMIEAEVTARMERGEQFPGWMITRGSGRRRFRYSADMLKLILPGVSVTTEEIVTPAELERRNVPERIVAALTEVPRTAPKLQKVPNGYYEAVFGLTPKGV